MKQHDTLWDCRKISMGFEDKSNNFLKDRSKQIKENFTELQRFVEQC